MMAVKVTVPEKPAATVPVPRPRPVDGIELPPLVNGVAATDTVQG